MLLRHALSLLLVFGTTAGCGKIEALSGQRKHRDDTRSAAEGELVKYVDRLQSQKSIGACDVTLRDRVAELAQVLDTKAAEIEAATAEQPPSSLFHRVTLGPITVRELNAPLAPRQGWQSDIYGWNNIYAYYQKIKDQPVDARWLALNSDVRATLVDDEDRLVYLDNMYLKREDYATLPDAKKAIDACVADEACAQPAFGPAAALLIKQNPFYSKLSDGTRSGLLNLKEWLDVDLGEKSMHSNPSLALADGGVMTIELDAGPFADVKPQLEAYITSVWADKAHKFRINWVSQADHPNAFRMVVEPGPGGRSFTSYRDKTVHLYADVRAKSIAHEIGHAIGFPDYYYTEWDPGTCTYKESYDETDLMSEPTSGSVTLDEWQALDSLLGVKPSA